MRRGKAETVERGKWSRRVEGSSGEWRCIRGKRGGAEERGEEKREGGKGSGEREVEGLREARIKRNSRSRGRG